MAIAKKCDRCGGYYDRNTKLFKVKNRLEENEFEGVLLMHLDRSRIHVSYDLCDSCIAGFLNWMKITERRDEIK